LRRAIQIEGTEVYCIYGNVTLSYCVRGDVFGKMMRDYRYQFQGILKIGRGGGEASKKLEKTVKKQPVLGGLLHCVIEVPILSSIN
jgi:hypothetical protein